MVECVVMSSGIRQLAVYATAVLYVFCLCYAVISGALLVLGGPLFFVFKVSLPWSALVWQAPLGLVLCIVLRALLNHLGRVGR
jgi:hypothetical protein